MKVASTVLRGRGGGNVALLPDDGAFLESQLSALPRAPLMPFDATGRMAAAIPFAFDDYRELVDTTGRVIREGKKGYIPGETPRILERLNIDP